MGNWADKMMNTDRVFCCSTLKPISVKVAVKIIIIMHQFRLKFYYSTLIKTIIANNGDQS